MKCKSMVVCQSMSLMHVLAVEPVVEEDPCNPNSCGPYSNPPRRQGDRCDCSCQTNMIGSPPNCHPECIFNNDCPTELACKNQRCVDPCPGLCGIHATCRVRSHIPICVCDKGFQGDPFTQCRRVTSKHTKNKNCGHILRTNIFSSTTNRGDPTLQPLSLWHQC